jgi:hypothetical protein
MIMVTGMAAASIARRNAILNAVPRALWFPIYERALMIVRGTVETFAERKDKALKAFAQFGVKPEQVYMALGLKGDADMTLEHIAPMRGMYSSLRDGSITVEEMFDPRRMTGTGFETVDNPLGDEDGGAPAPVETIDKKTGEIKAAAPAKKRAGRPRTKKAEPVPDAAKDPLADKIQAAKAESERQLEQEQTLEKSPAASPAAAPKTSDEYKEHLKAWLASSTSAAGIEDQWRQDRGLRTTCMIVEDAFVEARTMKDARIAELQPTQ